MANQIQVNDTPISHDDFVDAKDSWEDFNPREEATKSKIQSIAKEPKMKIPLLVPKHVIDKLSFPLANTTIEEIKIFGSNCSSQTSTELSTSFKKSTSLPNEESHVKFEGEAKSCCVQKNPIEISMRKAKSRELSKVKIEIKRTKKRATEFDNLCLQQEVQVGNGSIWASYFSSDGLFFATGGADHKLRIWEVNNSTQQCSNLKLIHS